MCSVVYACVWGVHFKMSQLRLYRLCMRRNDTNDSLFIFCFAYHKKIHFVEIYLDLKKKPQKSKLFEQYCYKSVRMLVFDVDLKFVFFSLFFLAIISVRGLAKPVCDVSRILCKFKSYECTSTPTWEKNKKFRLRAQAAVIEIGRYENEKRQQYSTVGFANFSNVNWKIYRDRRRRSKIERKTFS